MSMLAIGLKYYYYSFFLSLPPSLPPFLCVCKWSLLTRISWQARSDADVEGFPCRLQERRVSSANRKGQRSCSTATPALLLYRYCDAMEKEVKQMSGSQYNYFYFPMQ